MNHRFYDDIQGAGPAADPIAFDNPIIHRGRRRSVACFDTSRSQHFVAHNVLLRDDGEILQHAYWPNTNRRHMNTQLGYVYICIVLTRIERDTDHVLDDDDDRQVEEEDIVYQTTNERVAVKVNDVGRMRAYRERGMAEDPLQEIAALQLIGNDHPNVLGCREVLFDRENRNFNIVFPFFAGGELLGLVWDRQNNVPPGLPEDAARHWFRQIINGLQQLHSVGICHRDLSPENILIDGNRCAIIDLGMCLRLPYTDPNAPNAATDITRGTHRRLIRRQGVCGKWAYMSPEIGQRAVEFDGCAIDVWTAGVILFLILTGERIYEKPRLTDERFRDMTQDPHAFFGGYTLSDNATNLLMNMLQVDPRARLTIDEVLQHPWLAL